MLRMRAGTQEPATARATTRMAIGSLLIALVLVTASSAYPADDVPGWENTRWGMSEPEVRRSLESRGLPITGLSDPSHPSLRASAPFKTTVGIAGGHYDAIFLFAEDTGRLARVLIRTLDYSREHARKLHADLLGALTEKYGRPGETETWSSTASMMKWTFKTTTVILSLYTDNAAPNPHYTQVAVVYAPTAKEIEDPRDKLLGVGLLRALGEVGRGLR